MARVRLNPVIEQIRGAVGNLVFRRQGGRVIVTRKPEESDHPPTEAQQIQRDLFRQAAFYGNAAFADPDTREIYAAIAAARNAPIFSTMVQDFLRPPVVKEIDTSGYSGNVGDMILVTAIDEYGVLGVDVIITDDDGTLVEEGEAILDGWRWSYTAEADVAPGTTVHITARAVDRPGNTGVHTEEVVLPG